MRAETRSSFGLKYLDHLKRHERAIKQIAQTKSVKSIGDSQYFKIGWDEGSKKWVWRVKVFYIVYVFYACYQTFQLALDGIKPNDFSAGGGRGGE